MCQHCRRMEWTTCEPIPYACPLCPMRQVADRCDAPGRTDGRRHRYYRRHRQFVDSQMCRGISELYTHVVAAKRNPKTTKRKARKAIKERKFQQEDQQNISVLYREPAPHEASTWIWSPRDLVGDVGEIKATKKRSPPRHVSFSQASPYD